MELGQYTLDKFTKSAQKLPEPTVYKYLDQCLQGFKHLEKYNVIHRDYKPANMVITH